MKLNSGSGANVFRGFLDCPQDNAVEWQEIRVAGWALPPDQIKHIEITVDGSRTHILKLGITHRPDLRSAFPQISKAELGGFDGVVLLGDKEGPRELAVNALMSNGNVAKIAKKIVINSKLAIKIYNDNYISQFLPEKPVSNIWGRLVKKCEHNPPILPDVTRTQWYSPDQIINFQEHLLRRLICYSYNHIPYYRSLFKKLNLSPADIRSIGDLKKIPPLSRETAIKNYDKLVNPGYVLKTHRSGGTTGYPFRWAYSRDWEKLFKNSFWRGLGWAGLTPDKRVVSIYSRRIGEISAKSLVIQGAFDHDRIKFDLEAIRNFDPQFAYCYSSSAYLIARYLLDMGIDLPLEGVITTSDQLFPDYRPVIEQAFQCKVYNNYGCNDGGAWGAECKEQDGFHHDFERSIIEFDDYGVLLTTDLWNWAMPFIRYENGDTGSWIDGACRCGREVPRFRIIGRINDYLVTEAGVIPPTVVAATLRNECLQDFRVVQHSKYEIEIIYIRNKKCKRNECEKALLPLIEMLKGMSIIITETDTISRPSSNKQRLVENKLFLHSKELFKIVYNNDKI